MTSLRTPQGLGFLTAHLSSQQLQLFVAVPLRIAVVLALAVVVRLAASRAIRRIVRSTAEGRVGRRLAALGDRASVFVDTGAVAVARRRARAVTIASVLSSVVNTLVVVVGLITVLGIVGVDLGPILASAGIVGVAIGFGAQSLVRDLLAGLFLVLEDSFGVGDVIDAGPAVGTVESVGLRLTRLRDVHGTLWHIRNGEIARIANFSQNWQRALFDVVVPHGTDLDQARTVVQGCADALWTAPAYDSVVLEQPTVWGVQDVRPDGIVLRLAVKRRHGHDAFDRDLRERLLRAVVAAGIGTSADQTPVTIATPTEG